MASDEMTVANWYKVRELRPNLFLVREPADAAFYILKKNDQALLVDSGLGLQTLGRHLLTYLSIKKFSVLNTHAHCDHIGLNGLAENVTINRAEWDKFVRLDDKNQIGKYYRATKESLPWPSELNAPPSQLDWHPSRFVAENDVIEFSNWRLRAIFTPGHTSGHMIFWDSSEELLFLGDLLYDGTLYAHMPDSSFPRYVESLEKLNSLVGRSNAEVLWLSCHNNIPLGATYLTKAQQTFEKIANATLPPSSSCKSDDVFVDAQIFECNGVKVAVRSDNLPQIS